MKTASKLEQSAEKEDTQISKEAEMIFEKMIKRPEKVKLWNKKYGHLGLPMTVDSLRKICPYNCGKYRHHLFFMIHFRLNSEVHHIYCEEQAKLRDRATMRINRAPDDSDLDSEEPDPAKSNSFEVPDSSEGTPKRKK
jgi:hypothetical protein